MPIIGPFEMLGECSLIVERGTWSLLASDVDVPVGLVMFDMVLTIPTW